MKRIVLIAALLMTLPDEGVAASAGAQRHPDRVIAHKSVTGRLERFEEGDYLHVVVKSEDGRNLSFFPGGEACFLAENYEQTLEIRFVEVERYFPEGGGYYPANLIQSITVAGRKARWAAARTTRSEVAVTERCIDVLREKLGEGTEGGVPPN